MRAQGLFNPHTTTTARNWESETNQDPGRERLGSWDQEDERERRRSCLASIKQTRKKNWFFVHKK